MYAFWGCSCFTGSLIIPDSLISIGECVFHKCSGFDAFIAIVALCNYSLEKDA